MDKPEHDKKEKKEVSQESSSATPPDSVSESSPSSSGGPEEKPSITDKSVPDTVTSEEEKENGPLPEGAQKQTPPRPQRFRYLQHFAVGHYYLVLAKEIVYDEWMSATGDHTKGPLETYDFSLQKNKRTEKKIFSVTCQHAAMNKNCRDFLSSLKLSPVNIDTHIASARTLSQRLADFPEVRYAVVLLGPDEFFYAKDGKPGEAKLTSHRKDIFHVGYLIGKLGRENVTVLHYDQKNFCRPTDYFEAVYIPMDRNNRWQAELRERIKQAGYSIP